MNFVVMIFLNKILNFMIIYLIN